MVIPAPAPISPQNQVMEQLGRVCQNHGQDDLATRLLAFRTWLNDDLNIISKAIGELPTGERVVQQAANHLLSVGGKYLRPTCLAVAAKLGTGFHPEALKLAVAVEMVHTATLLHDDVVDGGEMRRGKPSARIIYGNAASVFAGDWLLVRALREVREARVPETLDRMLEVIEEMITAESYQLERRGQIVVNKDSYFRVIEGKTGALFRWAMFAGGKVGELNLYQCKALEEYGHHLGSAFQLVDDLLDFTGHREITGKALFTDLKEGKITYPLLIALERDKNLQTLLGNYLADEDSELPDTIIQAVKHSLEAANALEETRSLAKEKVERAISSLDIFPSSDAKEALITVAQASVYRER